MVAGLLKGEIGCQKILTGVCTELCGYLLPDYKDTSTRILVSLGATYHWPLHQFDVKKCISQWYPWSWGLHGATTRLYYSGKVCEGLQVEEVTLWSKTASESLVWVLCISDSEVWSLSRKERPLCVLANTRWEEDPTGYVCRWYCDHSRWYEGDW